MATTTRRATVADARAIGELQLRAWWRAYQDIVSPQHLMGHDAEERAGRWAELLASGLVNVLVAEVAEQVRGFVAIGPSREEEPDPREGELYAIFVDPAAQGAGLGTALLAEGEQALRSVGWSRATLRVFADNGYARTFYERHGWTEEPGTARTHDWDAPEVLYRRDL
jgi:ribosomal protein S18 acetylase RimI-like enzyme